LLHVHPSHIGTFIDVWLILLYPCKCICMAHACNYTNEEL
jgi:hypothetical protein